MTYQFTPAQDKVVQQLVLGKSNKEIAQTLGISVATVKAHSRNVFQRLGVSTRLQVVAKLQGHDTADTLPQLKAELEAAHEEIDLLNDEADAMQATCIALTRERDDLQLKVQTITDLVTAAMRNTLRKES